MTGKAAAAAERVLTAVEAQACLDQPISDHERDEVLALVRWFRGRYTTPASRLAYVRRAYTRWRRTLGHARVP